MKNFQSINLQLGKNWGMNKIFILETQTCILETVVSPLRGTEESDTLLDRMEAGDFRLCAAVPGDMVLFVICSLNTLGD